MPPACRLVQGLEAAGIEVLYDDRSIRPGAMFADADLFGLPIRAVVSPKTCERGVVEVAFRDKSFKADIAMEQSVDQICAMVKEQLDCTVYKRSAAKEHAKALATILSGYGLAGR